MSEWLPGIVALVVTFFVSLVVASTVAAIFVTKQRPRAISPRRARELGEELVTLVRVGGMEYSEAVRHYNEEVGALRATPLYPGAPIDELYTAAVAFRVDKWNDDHPDYPNPWEDA